MRSLGIFTPSLYTNAAHLCSFSLSRFCTISAFLNMIACPPPIPIMCFEASIYSVSHAKVTEDTLWHTGFFRNNNNLPPSQQSTMPIENTVAIWTSTCPKTGRSDDIMHLFVSSS